MYCLTVINVIPMYCTLWGRAVGVTIMWSLVAPCRIYTSVGVTESSIMPLYDHDDRTITETDTSSRWLPGLSLGALKLAFR